MSLKRKIFHILEACGALSILNIYREPNLQIIFFHIKMVFKIVISAEQEKIRPFFFFSRHFENFIEKKYTSFENSISP